MHNERIVVFGGSGFIGGYVLQELHQRGYLNIINADISDSPDLYFAEYISCDILDINKVSSIVEQGDYIFNFAGLAHLDTAVNKPLETMQLNVMGNLHILESCRKLSIKRFIFASSAYAMSNKGSFYGISKLSSEKLIEEFGLRYNLPYTILRYGSVYSERKFENNYIYNLVEQAIKKGLIEHDGDGQEIREYIHAADVARLSVDILEDPSYLNQHVVLTGAERLKRVELFEMIREILNNKVKIHLSTDSGGHHYRITPYSFSATSSKKLSPRPFIDMGQGVLECIKDVYAKNKSE
jgi:UDP-glucose 4-epimerase